MNTDRLREKLGKKKREPANCALVTGATGGIGEAFARNLPIETNLLLTGRNAAALERLKSELGPERTETIVADLTTAEGIDAAANAADAAGVDLLINNAGLGEYGAFLDKGFDAHRSTVRVNIEAVLALTHRLTYGMLERADLSGKRAGLINLSSSLAFFPVPTFATYAASKAFILSFTESLSAELSDKPIDVLCACPGAVKTEFGKRAGFAPGSIPGAMSPEKVAKASLDALGRQRTVVIGPVSATTFGPFAFARSAFGEAFMRASQVMERVQGRD